MSFFNHRYIIFLLLSLFLCISCEKEKVVVQGGTFKLNGQSFPIKNVRVDNVGFHEDDFVLRFTAYPATYSASSQGGKGYGTVMHAFLLSPTKDFQIGNSYDCLASFDSLYSRVITYPGLSEDNKPIGDTIEYILSSGSVKVDTLDGFSKFDFKFVTDKDAQIEGSYQGKYLYNYIVDQPAYGKLSFDTVSCNLATPTMWQWDHLFSENLNYFEFVFYSADSRFSDNGNINSGIQFVVGIMDLQQEWPAVATYPVSTNVSVRSVMYGHKLNNTAWGTYWQIFNKGSVLGKANIVSDTASIISIDDKNLKMQFKFKDQLGNDVVGDYDGPYIIQSIK